jgi:hypothetical protein
MGGYSLANAGALLPIADQGTLQTLGHPSGYSSQKGASFSAAAMALGLLSGARFLGPALVS